MNQVTSWTLVANGTAARIYRSRDPSDFTEIENFVNPVNRQHEQDLQSDRHGQAQSSASGHSQSYTEASFKKFERERFATDLADHLAEAYRNKSFDELNLVCGPRFLGLIRKHLTPTVSAVVSREVPKNLVPRKTEVILAHLRSSD